MAKARRGKSQGGKKRGKARALRMLIVEARFYEDISDALLRGARAVLDDAGAEYHSITVPGALEIPAAIAMALDGSAATTASSRSAASSAATPIISRWWRTNPDAA